MEEKGSLTESINESISDKAVYRTAPATPGLLIISYCSHFVPNPTYYCIGNYTCIFTGL